MDQGAGDQEEHTLEKGVVENVEARRCGCRNSKPEHHIAELRKGRVGENPLDIFLRACDNRCKNRRERSDGADNFQCAFARGKKREHPRDQINTGDNHRCGMDDGGNRCRTFHGVRKPDVQGEHGALSPAADKNQNGTEEKGVPGGNIPESKGNSSRHHFGLDDIQHAEMERFDDISYNDNAQQKKAVRKAGHNKRLL